MDPSSKTLPVIDVSEPASAKTAAALGAALRTHGFLYVKNHGVDGGLQSQLFKLSKKFFALPEDEKMKISMKQGGLAWRGYFPVGGELTMGRPDQKEGIYFGRELGPNDPAVIAKIPLHGANLWPAGDFGAEFKSIVLSYMNSVSDLAAKLMIGVGVGLGLPADYFSKRFTAEPTVLFRIFNYPEHVWTDQDDEWGVREHTDMGFLTVLLQDDSGGLEVKSGDGLWISAPPIKDTFVVNIGDMLELWTHGIYRATSHRVRNLAKGDRLSIPLFFDPHWNCRLDPIDKKLLPRPFLDEAERRNFTARWDGLVLKDLKGKMTYGEFVWRKVSAVFPNLVSKR